MQAAVAVAALLVVMLALAIVFKVVPVALVAVSQEQMVLIHPAAAAALAVQSERAVHRVLVVPDSWVWLVWQMVLVAMVKAVAVKRFLLAAAAAAVL